MRRPCITIMAIFKPFCAVRPVPEYASKVAALPYDVMDSNEARAAVKGNPFSFLHVDKAEIDLDEGIDPYSPAVYKKASENLRALSDNGICKKDSSPCFYIYSQVMDGREQTGLAGCASVDDYLNNNIKKHEFTRADKEEDRVHHVDACNANTGPIFLCYRQNSTVNELIADWRNMHTPVYDFDGADGNRHTVWVVDDADVCGSLSSLLEQSGAFYIADGHHRCASAVRVAQQRRKENPGFTGEEEFNFFLAVLFPAEQLKIMDYNRVVKDLNGYSREQFSQLVSERFTIEPVSGTEPYKPNRKHTFGMFIDGSWFKLCAKPGTFNASDPVEQLDVSVLQSNLLSPVLGIGDPRTDKRIDFIGGIRGLSELERRVNTDMRAAFSMYPTTLEELCAIADAGKVMPPKSTWFEPKLLSGLFIHEL